MLEVIALKQNKRVFIEIPENKKITENDLISIKIEWSTKFTPKKWFYFHGFCKYIKYCLYVFYAYTLGNENSIISFYNE